MCVKNVNVIGGNAQLWRQRARFAGSVRYSQYSTVSGCRAGKREEAGLFTKHDDVSSRKAGEEGW